MSEQPSSGAGGAGAGAGAGAGVSASTNAGAAARELKHVKDRFGGVIVDGFAEPAFEDAQLFSACLQLSLSKWQSEGVRGVWYEQQCHAQTQPCSVFALLLVLLSPAHHQGKAAHPARWRLHWRACQLFLRRTPCPARPHHAHHVAP